MDGIGTFALCCFIVLEYDIVWLTHRLDRLSGYFVLGGS